jgi:predicted transcriptional regulator
LLDVDENSITKQYHVFLQSFQIESNEIHATINIKDGMVIFHDDPEKFNNPKVLEEIEQKVSLF